MSEPQRELGWGVREVLHWLVDRGDHPLPADAPTAAEVHAAIDAVDAPASGPSAPSAQPEPSAPEAPPAPPQYEAPVYGGF